MIELESTENDKQDAARYRYMRENAAFEYRNGPGLYWYLPRYDQGFPIGERLDRAIDAELKNSSLIEKATPKNGL